MSITSFNTCRGRPKRKHKKVIASYQRLGERLDEELPTDEEHTLRRIIQNRKMRIQQLISLDYQKKWPLRYSQAMREMSEQIEKVPNAQIPSPLIPQYIFEADDIRTQDPTHTEGQEFVEYLDEEYALDLLEMLELE